MKGFLLNPMQRYLAALRIFISTALAAEMEYRANFLIAVLVAVANAAGSLFALFLFYQGDYRFAGWSWRQALIVVGLFTLLEGVSRTVFTANLSRLVEHVQQGTLDFILLKPMDAQFWLSTRQLSPWGLPNIAIGLGLVVYGMAGDTGESLTLLNLAFGAAAICLSVLILYSLWFMLATLSIWFVKIFNITEVLRSLLEAGRYPMAAYPPAWQFFFTFLVPVAFMTTVPAEALLGRASLPALAAAAVLALALFLASRGFWRFALRYYTSASS